MTPPWKQRLDALQIRDLSAIFRTPKPIIGMVHLWPLPGAPGYTGYGMQTIMIRRSTMPTLSLKAASMG